MRHGRFSLETADYFLTGAGMRLQAWLRRFLQIIFDPRAQRPLLNRMMLVLLAVGGIWHWIHFFGTGHLDLDFEDWPKEKVYLNILREAVVTHTIPFHMDVGLQGTQRFLGLPETMLAPQALLLPWLSNQQFVVFQTCLMFLVGLTGCWLLGRRFGWSVFVFVAFTAIFSFNGFITCRLAVGHFMWTGYYLSPWMLLATLRVLDVPQRARGWIELSAVFFALFLVGAFHIAVWWMIFLLVAAFVRPQLLLPLVLVLVFVFGLCLFRILPAAYTFWGAERTFASGYPDFVLLIRSLVQPLTYDTPFVQAGAASLGWWEFNHFIGLPAVIFLCVYVFRRSQDPETMDSKVILWGAGVVAALSLSQFYAPIMWLPFPLFNSERISSRFLSVSLFLALFLASNRLHGEAKRLSSAWRAVALVLLVQTLMELKQCAAGWRLPLLEATHGPSPYWENSEKLVGHIQTFPHEMKYKLVVVISWCLSALGVVGAAVAWFRLGSKQRTELR